MQVKRPLVAFAAAAALLALPVYSVFGGSSDPAPPEDLAVREQATALDGSFTYQGRLTENNAAANGTYDFRFTIYGAETGSAQVCATAANDVVERGDVSVTNGLFTVLLDFCAETFNSNKRWLEIAVRPGSATGTYTVLSPRQPISPTPYALYATRAGGFTVPFSATGATTGTGAILSLTQTGTAATTFGLTVEGAAGVGAKIAGDAASVDLDGPIRVSGTKSAFQVVVDVDTNVCEASSSDNNNGVVIPTTVASSATDMLFVTVSGTTTVEGGFGVVFDDPDCTNDSWVIHALSGEALLDGMTFNVLVIKQ